ncbi:uncharacterized protein L201_006471 [Kwoniella dendrophila CBS 6074]|uniref:Uncharacterized protein n=1 Tax=Kwoniella dendrophila CBS 6074 TaxID=1295534 RepID=A0AAX4K1L4_9TREE
MLSTKTPNFTSTHLKVDKKINKLSITIRLVKSLGVHRRPSSPKTQLKVKKMWTHRIDKQIYQEIKSNQVLLRGRAIKDEDLVEYML